MKLKEMTDARVEGSPTSSGRIAFTKLQGNGNDFVLIDEQDGVKVADPLKGSFAVQCCHRNSGSEATGFSSWGRRRIRT